MKRYAKKLIGVAMLSVLVLSGCSEKETAATGEVITIKVGHISPPEHSYSIGFDQFAEAVEKETDGQVKFEVFGGGQLGGERDLVEQVQIGTLDMTLATTGPVVNFVPNLGAIELPFLFDDLDHVYSTLDGEVGQDLLAEMSDSNFKGLGFWENGMRHLTNNKKEIRTPEDLKGLKMRTLENDVFVETYRALGADPTPIAFPEVYTSFQQGVVDGSDFSIGVFESTKQLEVQPHLTETGVYYASAVLMMNLDKFNELPADVQDVMVRLGKEYAVIQRQITQDMEADQLERIKEHGVTVVPSSEVDLEAFKAAVQPVYERYASRFGDYVERIQANR